MTRGEDAHHLTDLLARNNQLHEHAHSIGAHLAELQGWQAQRLAEYYKDLYEKPRYRKAIDFFLTDLYGGKNLSRLDHDLQRAEPILVRLLPKSALRILTLAIELQVLSQELDIEMTKALSSQSPITNDAYVAAYRKVDDYARRSRQIHLAIQAGYDLDRIVQKPTIYAAMRMAHGPAHLAGFGVLQDFVERGFMAFRHMRGAREFLDVIETRETGLMERLFSEHPDPLGPTR